MNDRASRRAEGAQTTPSLAPTQLPCPSLCLACGRLVFPSPRVGYRVSAAALNDRCAHCRGDALVDMTSADAAQLVHDLDVYDRLSRGALGPRLVRRAAVLTAALSFAAVIALAAFAMFADGGGRGWQVHAPLAVLFGVVLGVPMITTAARFLRRQWQRTRPKKLPARWYCPLPPRSRGAALETAQVMANDELLVAPLSGRPCVAYEIAVRDAAVHGSRLGSWSLLEQRSTALTVGGRTLAADSAFLQLPRARVTPESIEARDRRARFLRTRGFLVSGAELDVYETIVRAGETVTLTDSRPPVLRAHER